jgi:NADPH2:quinone reductase
MKALLATRWCEPRDLVYADVPTPEPGPGDVLIDVRAIGCNFPDILIVQGKYQKRPPLPFSPGAEASGVVRACGPGVTRVAPGDRVFAITGWGAYAEALAVPERQVYRLPSALGFEEGAAFGLVYQTSWCALVHRAALRPGEWLLVHGAAGGVGLAAVQIGKALGGRVIATAGTRDKLEIARQSGADALIDYRTEDWVARVKELTAGAGADVIYDPVGGDVFDGSTRCLAFEGRLLVVGFAGGRIPEIAANRILLKNISVVGVHWGLYQERGSPRPAQWMDELLALVERGVLRPVVWKRFPLAQAADALAAIATRESYGKVILVP